MYIIARHLQIRRNSLWIHTSYLMCLQILLRYFTSFQRRQEFVACFKLFMFQAVVSSKWDNVCFKFFFRRGIIFYSANSPTKFDWISEGRASKSVDQRAHKTLVDDPAKTSTKLQPISSQSPSSDCHLSSTSHRSPSHESQVSIRWAHFPSRRVADILRSTSHSAEKQETGWSSCRAWQDVRSLLWYSATSTYPFNLEHY